MRQPACCILGSEVVVHTRRHLPAGHATGNHSHEAALAADWIDSGQP
jgi:hypothetical protein